MKKWLIMLLIGICFSGCSYTHEEWARNNMGFISYSNSFYPQRPADYSVELYYSDNKPSADYVIIGKIDAFIEASNKINPLLKAKVRQSGGDGAINIKTELLRIEQDSYVSASAGYHNMHSPEYAYSGAVTPYRSVLFRDVYRVSAEVIRFKNEKADVGH